MKYETERAATTLSEADREYLTMMYKENAEHARQHENLRAVVGSLFMTLIAGLLVIASDRWVVGLSSVHRERSWCTAQPRALRAIQSSR